MATPTPVLTDAHGNVACNYGTRGLRKGPPKASERSNSRRLPVCTAPRRWASLGCCCAFMLHRSGLGGLSLRCRRPGASFHRSDESRPGTGATCRIRRWITCSALFRVRGCWCVSRSQASRMVRDMFCTKMNIQRASTWGGPGGILTKLVLFQLQMTLFFF